MPGISFSKKVGRWELLNAALKRHLSELPELANVQEELEQLIGTAKAAEDEERELRGKLQRASRLRRQMEIQSQDLRQRLAEELRDKLGAENKLLPLYGLVPRRARGPRSEPKAAEPAPSFTSVTRSH